MSKAQRETHGSEMVGVREYAEGYEVRIGTNKAGEPACIGGELRDSVMPEDRDVIIAYNEAAHNSVSIDVQDLVAWLLVYRSDLFQHPLYAAHGCGVCHRPMLWRDRIFQFHAGCQAEGTRRGLAGETP